MKIMKDLCRNCGKGGIFLKLNNEGLCTKCAAKAHEEELGAAIDFINELSSAVKIATEHTTVLSSFGAQRISAQKNACDYVLEHIDDWKSFKAFAEAFTQTETEYDEKHQDWKSHPIFPHILITKHDEINFEEHFAKLRKTIDDIKGKCLIAGFNAYDYDRLFHVVGVTFSDGEKSRQTTIRRLGKGYTDDYNALSLKRYLFNNEDAVGVFAGDNQVGNISKGDLPWLIEHWKEYIFISAYEVVGEDPLGLYIRACFRRVDYFAEENK